MNAAKAKIENSGEEGVDESLSVRKVCKYVFLTAGICSTMFVLYIASVGPALLLYEKGIGKNVIEILYTPAEGIYNASPLILRRMLDKYIDLWKPHV